MVSNVVHLWWNPLIDDWNLFSHLQESLIQHLVHDQLDVLPIHLAIQIQIQLWAAGGVDREARRCAGAGIACVAHAIAIRVGLGGVLGERAVVEQIDDTITIAVTGGGFAIVGAAVHVGIHAISPRSSPGAVGDDKAIGFRLHETASIAQATGPERWRTRHRGAEYADALKETADRDAIRLEDVVAAGAVRETAGSDERVFDARLY